MSTNFERSVFDLIRMRSSWRSYSSRPLDGSLCESVLALLESKTAGPLGHRMRFQLIEKAEAVQWDNVKLGTYGYIKNPHYFIAGAVVPGDKHWEDYGFVLEEIILKMTDLRLATCWIGGTFKRSEFAKTLKLAPHEVIPAVTPVGHPTDSRSFRDRVIRMGAKSKSRKPWENIFFEKRFESPLESENAGAYADVLEMVRLGPSASNKQPWRIVKDGDNFHFFLQRTSLSIAHKTDLQRVDMGIAMCHFSLAATEAGLAGGWIDRQPEITLPKNAEYTITWAASR